MTNHKAVLPSKYKVWWATLLHIYHSVCWWKSVNMWQSYRQEYSVLFFDSRRRCTRNLQMTVILGRGAPIMLWLIIGRPVIGRLPIVYFRTHLRPIKVTERYFKSNSISTRLLFRLFFVLLNVEDDTWLITESLVISLSSMWTAVKSIFCCFAY